MRTQSQGRDSGRRKAERQSDPGALGAFRLDVRSRDFYTKKKFARREVWGAMTGEGTGEYLSWRKETSRERGR